MAKIRDVAVTIEAAAVASSVLEMPVHEAGDLLLLWFNKDTISGGPASVSGWSVPTAWGSNPLNTAGSGNYLFAKRATSSSETVTLTYTSETSLTAVVSIRDVNGSTVDDAFGTVAKAASDDSTLPFTGGTFTPANNNSLLIGLLGTDTGFGPEVLPGWKHLVSADAAANSLAVSYTTQRTAAAITHPDYWAQGVDDTRWALLEIRDGSGGAEIDSYPDRGTTIGTLVSLLCNNTAVVNRGLQKTGTNPALDITTLNSLSVTGLTAVTNAADTGLNPFHGTLNITPTSSKTLIVGQELTFTAAENMTLQAGVLFGTWQFVVPRDYLDCATAAKGGVLVGIADAENDYRFWCIGAQLAQTTYPDGRKHNYAIEVADNSTIYAESGTLALNAINDFYMLGRGYFGAMALYFSKLYLLNKFVLAGGSASVPTTFAEIADTIQRGTNNLPVAQLAGAACTLWIPVQFGGGDAVHVSAELGTFQYPKKANETTHLDFHVSNDKMGFEFYGKDRGGGDVDTLHFIGCVFTAPQSYYWRFNASHSSNADTDFTGCTVVGANITLQTSVALDTVTFTNSTAFTQNAAALNNCVFNNTKVTSADLAAMDNITNCSFNSSGTGHAIEVSGTASTITFTGNTFTGYAASNGSTGNEAIYVNIATGTVTINIAGGGSTPSIRTAGATVNVVSGATVTFTGLPTGCDIVILTAGTSTILDQVDSHGSTSYAWGYQGTPTIDVGFIKPGYVPYYIRALALSTSDSSIPVSMTLDRNYA